MNHNEKEEENRINTLPPQNAGPKRKTIIDNVINSIFSALKTGTGFRMTSVTEEINIKLIESEIIVRSNQLKKYLEDIFEEVSFVCSAIFYFDVIDEPALVKEVISSNTAKLVANQIRDEIWFSCRAPIPCY